MRRFFLPSVVTLFISACSTVSGPFTPASGSVVPGFSGMQGMLAVHNQVRARVGLPPLTWSNELTAYSQDWANHLAVNNSCRMKHRSAAGRNPKQYGENLYWASHMNWSDGRIEPQRVSAAKVAGDWAAEVKDYNHARNRCRRGAQCGHYTQMVWRDTKQVGCAMSLCPNQEQVWVCSYNPPGNWTGQRPY